MHVRWHQQVAALDKRTASTQMQKVLHLRLLVHGRVPVRVIEYHAVRARQIDAHAAAPRAQNEAEVLLVRVEPRHEVLALRRLRAAVEAHVDVAVQVQENFQDVEHFAHLREDEAARTRGFELRQEDGQPLQLACTWTAS
jgi:hypothetical protein